MQRRSFTLWRAEPPDSRPTGRAASYVTAHAFSGQPARARSSRPAAGREGSGMHVKASVTVNRSPHETYRYWRDFANLPRFMQHLDSVQVTSDTRSHWRSKAPLGRSVEWDAEIVADQPGEHIGWRSL